MTKERIYEFISNKKTSFISSIDEDGFPATRALIQPRLIDGDDIYFATYTSSNKVRHYLNNPKACIYFYERGKNYQGVMIKGNIEVLTDQATKNKLWLPNYKFFYKEGMKDPEYCILKFTGFEAQYFSSFKVEKVKF